MDNDQQLYSSYLLRMWPTRNGDRWVWRASLENPHMKERRGFTSLQELFAYLEEQTRQALTCVKG